MSKATITATFPSVEDVAKSPAFPTVMWQLEPHRSGLLPVAARRGGPLNISWEVHGDGPVKLILISGLGFFKAAFQRQTMYFGHMHGSQYSVLILDNRGMGGSDKPLMRYSTSEMARDIIEVADHIGWTSPRQLHVCGISMGGMIAQELGYLVPNRIATLSLICTAARIENTTSFTENMVNRVTMLLPKSMDRSVQYAAEAIFPPNYLAGSDNASVPDESVPKCKIPTGGYGRFGSNYERFAAQEITKQRDKDGFTKKGFLLQLIAAGWHNKSPEQLTDLGDSVGRKRILVLHGTDDGMISPHHGQKLIEYLKPGQGLIVDGLGHAPINERTSWFNELLEGQCSLGEKLNEQ
ncbi:alpha/beta-hydrolase [Annulohypoxylon maeteangense]|uniref:alpha/beta-hydrolase n=1 Tax=Annulohypoxylon maeteangense TaxID=1927788 RepID=UPI002008984C|nr:alpha/beta-hydrolase [Annulohypoxylon maeteangense]KAI0882385.1 alpha/beta-hydrolase [Annulohypoxylon maeteangense]